MNPATAYQPPARETPATLRDIISVQSTLATLLAEETVLMDRMQLAKVGMLQERKLKLTAMLERYTRYIHKHPDVLAQTSEEEKADMREASARFQQIMKKNYDTLLVARAVNNAVVKCVTEVVAGKAQNPVYNAFGATKRDWRPMPVSITLNETA